MKKLFIALFISFALIGLVCCSNVNAGPQTKTVTVRNHLECEAELNGYIIEGTTDAGNPHTEPVILELGRTYDLRVGEAVLQDYIDCNVDIVSICPAGNGFTVIKSTIN